MRTAIRKIGNSRRVLIPKPMLAETGLDGDVDISVENGANVLRSIQFIVPSFSTRSGGDTEAGSESQAGGNDGL